MQARAELQVAPAHLRTICCLETNSERRMATAVTVEAHRECRHSLDGAFLLLQRA